MWLNPQSKNFARDRGFVDEDPDPRTGEISEMTLKLAIVAKSIFDYISEA